MLQTILCHPGRYFCYDLKKVTLHQVRLSHATCYIAAVQLSIGKFEPFPQVLQAEEGVISERICAVIANTTELPQSQDEQQILAKALTAVIRL